MKNKFAFRVIFDILVGAVIFLPLFSALFLWQTFFNIKESSSPVVFSIPKLDEKAITEIKNKTQNREYFSRRPFPESSSARFGEADPFRQ